MNKAELTWRKEKGLPIPTPKVVLPAKEVPPESTEGVKKAVADLASQYLTLHQDLKTVHDRLDLLTTQVQALATKVGG